MTLDSNHANANAEDHWNEVVKYAPTVPEPDDTGASDWAELGEFAWHYSVVGGHFGDDAPELEEANSLREQIEACLPSLEADQLRAYIVGIMGGISEFMWLGL